MQQIKQHDQVNENHPAHVGGRMIGAGAAMVLGHITFAEIEDKVIVSVIGASISCFIGFFGTWFLQWSFKKMKEIVIDPKAMRVVFRLSAIAIILGVLGIMFYIAVKCAT